MARCKVNSASSISEMENTSNCYAAHLGNCLGGSSREHYISRSVLEIVGAKFQISGFPWQQPEQQMEVGIGALVSRILCNHHNSELSILDETGNEFVRALKSSFGEALGNDYAEEEFSISGEKLELWLLKILCGIIRVFGTVSVPRRWVDILFRNEPFPNGWGMHLFSELGTVSWFFQLVRVVPVLNEKRSIAGAKFGIGGLALLLAFGKPQFEDGSIQSMYRPKSIVVRRKGNAKKINLSWPRGTGGGSIHLKVEGSIEQEQNSYRPIVIPDGKKHQ
jgi:hypothetical protein